MCHNFGDKLGNHPVKTRQTLFAPKPGHDVIIGKNEQTRVLAGRSCEHD